MSKRRAFVFCAAIGAAGLVGCGGDGGDDSGPDAGGGNGNGNGNGNGSGLTRISSELAELDGRGDWGSLVISGYGEVNNGDDNLQTTTEAVPDGIERWFGGDDNADSSGTIEYVILAETGEAFRPDEEVQGLTVEGSGSGTTISHVQVTNSDDDGIEWFGGAAEADHVVIQGVTDDSLDMDLGYQGAVSHALVVQGTNYGDRGIESDSNGDDFGAEPKTAPVISNLTILGNSGNDSSSLGALHREGFGGQVYRSVYADDTALENDAFGFGCLDIDDELDDELAYGDVVFACDAGALVDDEDEAADGTSFQDDFAGSPSYGVLEDPAGFSIDEDTLAVSIDGDTDGAYSDEFETPSGSAVTPEDYFGALDPDESEAWWQGWTLRQSGIEGNLPGGDFHPLEEEIASGTIAPAEENGCADKGNGLAALPENVEIFGETFPVCVIVDGDLDGEFTLTSDHVYILDGTVQVGNGDVESAFDPDTVREDVLTIEPGTQIMGVSETDPSLVITRGSRIEAAGTAEQPIIFGAVDVE